MLFLGVQMKPEAEFNFTNFTSFSNMSLTPVPVVIKTIDLDSTVLFYGGPGEKQKQLDKMLAAVDTVQHTGTKLRNHANALLIPITCYSIGCVTAC